VFETGSLLGTRRTPTMSETVSKAYWGGFLGHLY